MRVFIGTLIRGIWYVGVLTFGSFTALVEGVWREADRIARMWEWQINEGVRRGRTPLPMGHLGVMYWLLRMFSFILMILLLMGLSWFLYWILFL